MIFFQVLNCSRVTEILKIQCHFYILMTIVVILRKIHGKIKSFAPPQKEIKHIHAPKTDLLHTVLDYEISIGANARSRYYTCFAKKRFSLKLAKFTGNSCARGRTCEFCKIFKNTFFTEQLRTTASESGYCNYEARDIDCICCRELDQCLLLRLKSQSAREESHHPAFMGICPTISHTYQFYLPDR